MADVDKLNIDSIIQRLLEGKEMLNTTCQPVLHKRQTLTLLRRLALACVYQQLGN